MTGAILHEEVLAGAKHWSFVIPGGTLLRLTDLEGGANVGMLMFNPKNPLERYNAPDTLKCQHTFKLTRGNCLFSDMGRIFCSIVTDTAGWHDTVCGNTNRAAVARKWGERGYQQYRNDWTQNGHDSFMVEGGKWGLGRRDLHANVNWFSKVSIDDEGAMHYAPGHSKPGDHVELRFEMDTLALLHTCPHPLNPVPVYPRKPVGIRMTKAAPVAEDDFCLNFRPENGRGFEITRGFRFAGEMGARP